MAKSKIFTTYYRDAQVFRDTNGNGVLDAPSEILLRTDGNGAFSAPAGKGRFVLKGGFDINTGEDNPYDLLSAPSAARSVGPLTSVWQSLLDRGASQNKIKKLVGVPLAFGLNKYSALRFDDIRDKNQEIGVRKEGQVDLLTQWVSRIADTTFGARFAALGLEGEALKAALQAAEDKIIGDFAQSLLNLGIKKVDLSDQGIIRSLLDSTLSRSDINLTAAQLDAASQAASEINDRFDLAPIGRLDEVAIVGANSARVFAARDFDALVAEYTGANLLDQIQNNDIYIPAPTNLSLADDTGASAVDGVTRDNAPTLSGRASLAADRVNIYLDGVKVGEAPVANGTWSFASPSLLDGHYNFTFKGVNALGHEGAVSQTRAITVDTAPPAVPTVTPLITADATPTVEGAWTPGTGESLSIQIDGKTYTAANGLIVSGNAWSLTLPVALAPGKYEVLAQATDLAGNVSADTSANELEILASATGFALTSDAPAGVPAREGDVLHFTVAPIGGAVAEDTILTLDLVGAIIGGAKGQASAADFDPSRLTIVFEADAIGAQTVSVVVEEDGIAEGVEGYQAILSKGGAIVAKLDGLIDDPANAPPAVSGVADVSGLAGAMIALPDLTFFDAENDALTVTVTATGGALGGLADADGTTPGIQLAGSPEAVTAAFAGATFAGASAGAGNVALSVSDGVNAPVTANIGVTLTAAGSTFELSGPAIAVEGTQVVYTVARVGDASKAAVVDFTLLPGGGASQADYAALGIAGADVTNLSGSGGTLNFPAGSAQADITLSIVSDGLAETGETLAASLIANPSDPSGSAISATKGSLLVSLQDPPTTTFVLKSSVAADAPTREGDTLVFTVTPDSPVTADTTLTFNLAGATVGAAVNQTSAQDFSLSSQTISFKAGDAGARTVSVLVVADGAKEGPEGYQASLLDSASKTLAALTGVVDDPLNAPPAVGGVADVSGVAGTAIALPDLTFSDADQDALTVTATATGGTVGGLIDADEATPGIQLAGSPEAVTAAFAAATFAGAGAGAGNVALSVSDGVNAPVAANVGVTLTASSTFELSGPTTVTEGNRIVYSVARVGDASKAAVVDFTLLPGGGASQADYAALGITGADVTNLSGSGGTLNFPAGAAKADITLSIVADGVAETGETLAAGLRANPSDASGGAVSDTKGALLIALQDPPPSVFELSGPTTVTEGDRVVYSVARVGDASKAAVVDFTLLPGGGASQADYAALGITGADVTNLSGSGGTLNFPAGAAKADITLSIVADGVAETGETLAAGLRANPSDASGGAVSDTKGSLLIALQDPPASATIAVSAANSGPFSDSAATNTAYNLAAGAYDVNLAGFGPGDKLAFPAGASLNVVNGPTPDGNIEVSGALNGQLIQVHMTGVDTALDSGVFSVSSFNNVFGAGSLA
jgi:hypothetical protein